jgi:RNA polymerase sigma-54 factor
LLTIRVARKTKRFRQLVQSRTSTCGSIWNRASCADPSLNLHPLSVDSAGTMSEFRLQQGLHVRAEQTLSIQPRMLQSIEMLQMARYELEGYVADIALQNEALELDATSPARGEVARATAAGWEATEAHDQMLRNQPERDQSLCEMVERQLAAADFEPRHNDWLRFLVGCIDERGFLSGSDDQLLNLAHEGGMEGEHLELAMAIADLQELGRTSPDLIGLGARGAIEALLLQLDPEDQDYALLCRLLEEFLEELARNKLPRVARALGIELDELERLIAALSELDSRPLTHLAEMGSAALRPDVIVEWTGEGFDLRLARGALPTVTVDSRVADMAKDRELPTDLRKYLRGKVDEARFVVEAVQQRGQTLLRVCHALFQHQSDFLEHGSGHLKPLLMVDLAAELDVHVSTVSRSVQGKIAQTPWGLLPLRSFFQAKTGGSNGGARDDVREKVRDLVAAEDSHSPLSDDDIVRELQVQGLKVARRTVAKYRGELGIQSSYRRRRFQG